MPTKDMLIRLVTERGKMRNTKRKPTFQALCLQQEKQKKKRMENKKPKPGLTYTRQPDNDCTSTMLKNHSVSKTLQRPACSYAYKWTKRCPKKNKSNDNLQVETEDQGSHKL